VNKSKWHARAGAYAPPCGPWFRKTGTEMAPLLIFEVLGRVLSTRCPNSRLRRGINEVCTLLVFSQKGFPKISDAENARAASQYLLEAGWIIEIGFYYNPRLAA